MDIIYLDLKSEIIPPELRLLVFYESDHVANDIFHRKDAHVRDQMS